MQADQVVTGWVGGVTWNSLMPGDLLTQRDHWLVRGGDLSFVFLAINGVASPVVRSVHRC